ncbi:flagellar hook-length control protein FliK [Nocardioides caldifontis]|uniref:flagellar hook-length control protein FliK n=1 Tax=Nocardioides caldifontis TaxID=2588938 RepID=UPI0011DFC4A3|nr:flagellar hook-length control protein FliK [Nocardioides caldifontis]
MTVSVLPTLPGLPGTATPGGDAAGAGAGAGAEGSADAFAGLLGGATGEAAAGTPDGAPAAVVPAVPADVPADVQAGPLPAGVAQPGTVPVESPAIPTLPGEDGLSEGETPEATPGSASPVVSAAQIIAAAQVTPIAPLLAAAAAVAAAARTAVEGSADADAGVTGVTGTAPGVQPAEAVASAEAADVQPLPAAERAALPAAPVADGEPVAQPPATAAPRDDAPATRQEAAPAPAAPAVAGTSAVTLSSTTAPAAASASGAEGSSQVTGQVFPEVSRLVSRGDGTQRITLKLSPEALGDVRVVLTVRGGEVHVRMAGGEAAQQALLQGAPELHRLLEATGATSSRLEIGDARSTFDGGRRDHAPDLAQEQGTHDHQTARKRAGENPMATDGATGGVRTRSHGSTEPATRTRPGVDVTM